MKNTTFKVVKDKKVNIPEVILSKIPGFGAERLRIGVHTDEVETAGETLYADFTLTNVVFFAGQYIGYPNLTLSSTNGSYSVSGNQVNIGETGRHIVTFSGSWAAQGAGDTRKIFIEVNGTRVCEQMGLPSTIATHRLYQQVHWCGTLSAGDYVKAGMEHDDASGNAWYGNYDLHITKV